MVTCLGHGRGQSLLRKITPYCLRTWDHDLYLRPWVVDRCLLPWRHGLCCLLLWRDESQHLAVPRQAGQPELRSTVRYHALLLPHRILSPRRPACAPPAGPGSRRPGRRRPLDRLPGPCLCTGRSPCRGGTFGPPQSLGVDTPAPPPVVASPSRTPLRSRAAVHSRPSGPESLGHMWLSMYPRSAPSVSVSPRHCSCSICRWNGRTSHRYHTTNSPTSRGRYRWMIRALNVAEFPLWYRVAMAM